MGLRNGFKSTIIAFENGAKILEEFASEMEFRSKASLEKAKISRRQKEIERDIKAKKLIKAGDESILADWKTLVSLYDQEVVLSEDYEKREIEKKRDAVALEIKKEVIRKKSEQMRAIDYCLVNDSFGRAIDKIRKLNELRLCVEDLIVLSEEDGEGFYHRLVKREEEIRNDVRALELKRETVENNYYKNGAIESRIQRYDGFLCGKSQYWHNNGRLRLEYTVANGLVFGAIKKFYKDGSILFDGSISKSGRFRVVGYSKSGLQVVNGEFGAEGYLDCWIGGKVYAGRLWVEEKRPCRLRFISFLLLKPKVFCFFWGVNTNFVFKRMLVETNRVFSELKLISEDIDMANNQRLVKP